MTLLNIYGNESISVSRDWNKHILLLQFVLGHITESDFSETKLYIWEFDAYYYVMLLLATAMQYVKLTKSIQEPPLLP